MPTLIEMRLKATWTVHPDTRQLHGLACALFETDRAEHFGQDKPFTVWPLDAAAGEWRLRAAWLPDEPAPVGAGSSGQLRVGHVRCLVAESIQRRVTHAALAAGPALVAVTVRFISPVFFSQNGMACLVPDPRLVAGSWRRRWNSSLPAGDRLAVTDDAWQDTHRALGLAAYDLRTQIRDSGHGKERTGFTGTATLRLARTAPASARQTWAPWPGSPSTAVPARRPPTGSARPPCYPITGRPMGEVLDRARTEQRLLDAWAEVRDAALADGDAGREVEQFEAAAARHVSQLAVALADGTFEPRPVVRVRIPKPDGGVRKLAVPGLTDRIVERALLPELDALIDPLLLPWSFAYRHGLGVRDAVACLAEARDAGAAWVARCDIDDCFDHIPRWEVLRRLRDVVPDPAAVDLVRRFMDRPVTGEHVAHAARGLGLHQGSPLSPLLCNLYLDTFDRAMLARGYRAIRYSDDIAIPVTDRGSAEASLSDAARELGELRLTLDQVKSQAVSFDAGVPFLGTVVTSLTSPGALALSHPMETVVYVDRPGSLIRSRGDRIVVEHQGQALFRLNFKRIRQVVCVGQVGMTTPFIHRALRDGIDVIMLDEHGGPGGRLMSLACTDATARRAQYRAAGDEHAARELARGFVGGKIANMRVSLLRASRRVPDPMVISAAETLAITRLVLGDATTYDQILGHEGAASREYFRAWRQIIGETWGFTARERRPPPDPVNAMLSFGYTMLVQEAIAALEAAGLDSAAGFLHRGRWGRPCLALDLMEEFRPVIVDAVVLRCVSTGIVRSDEFTSLPDLGCRMSARARQAFLAAYERRMLTLFTHEPTGRRVSYRVGLGLQARSLARALLEPGRIYRAVRWK